MRRFLENSEKEQNLGTLQREEYRKAKLPADPLPEGRQGALCMERIPQERFGLSLSGDERERQILVQLLKYRIYEIVGSVDVVRSSLSVERT